jgi:hypothetical protein
MDNVNDLLRSLYKCHWKSLEDAIGAHWGPSGDLSYPLLVNAPPEYEKCARKLLIVGHQTSGWDNGSKPLTDDPIGDLMGEYERFALGKWYRPTPFYQASYVIQMSLNPSGPAFGFVWTNLVKVDRETIRPTEEVENLICETFPVVADEIRILDPDVVVFFTGPYYDRRLEQIFPGAAIKAVKADRNYVSRVEHKALPARSFRTYHPGYLARSKVYGEVMRSLINCCVGSDAV